MTGSAIKVPSMELVPPFKVHREEAKPGGGVSKLRSLGGQHPRKLFSAEFQIIYSLLNLYGAKHRQMIKYKYSACWEKLDYDD